MFRNSIVRVWKQESRENRGNRLSRGSRGWGVHRIAADILPAKKTFGTSAEHSITSIQSISSIKTTLLLLKKPILRYSTPLMDKVEIYTDGACSGNPGPGGTGTVLICGENRKELSEGYRKTTNNRMELMAAIIGLSALKRRSEVELYSDSSYLVNAMEKGWVQVWQVNNWKKKKNRDLWLQLLELNKKHDISFIWVKGHADNELNNRCDELAVEAAGGEDLQADAGYEAEIVRLEAQGELL